MAFYMKEIIQLFCYFILYLVSTDEAQHITSWFERLENNI